jgi:hypothetical protein
MLRPHINNVLLAVLCLSLSFFLGDSCFARKSINYPTSESTLSKSIDAAIDNDHTEYGKVSASDGYPERHGLVEHVGPVSIPVNRQDQYPRSIGHTSSHKFTPNGTVLPFPGNTIVSHLSLESPLYRYLRLLASDMKDQDFASYFVFLPPQSWHMTLFEGVSYPRRRRETWPAELAMDTSLRTCHAHVASRLAEFRHELGNSRLQMRIADFESVRGGVSLRLVPVNSGTEAALQAFRDRLSELLGMRHPGHERYSFHLTVAYSLRILGDIERSRIETYLRTRLVDLPEQIELGRPEFCVFDDMFEFRRVFFLAAMEDI